MTIDIRCSVCKNPDRRRIIELGWNGGMSQSAMAAMFDGITAAAISKHVREHAEGDVHRRELDVEPERPARERVLALQKMQLDEVERRIALAKQRADMLNAVIDDLRASGTQGADETPYHDWSEFFDILGKDGQSAIGSILKVQGLTDKREQKTSELKLGLFEAMARNGLAPKGLVGEMPKLPAGETPVEETDDEDD